MSKVIDNDDNIDNVYKSSILIQTYFNIYLYFDSNKQVYFPNLIFKK